MERVLGEDASLAGLLAPRLPAGADADLRRLAELSDFAEAFVGTTVEELCRIEAMVPQERRTPEHVARIEQVKAHLEALEAILVRSRGKLLQAGEGD